MIKVFRSILIPTDFSPAAWNAMLVGLELAKAYGSSLTLLHVFPTGNGNEEMSGFKIEDQLNKVKANMEKIGKGLTEENHQRLTNVVVSGNVRQQLEEFVQKHNFDLVIMGSNSSGSHNTPGTHTMNMIEHSKTPILVVPNQYDDNE